ncbi:MAG: FAD:protein FMN transferase [Halioglobus sp.]
MQEQLSGATMGTTWHLTYVVTPGTPDADFVAALVQAELDAVNASMSTYLPDSEITRFNKAPGDTWVTLSDAFLRVLDAAMRVGQESGGAYDVTVAPLVDLWGFGPKEANLEPPPKEAIAVALARVGQARVQRDPQRRAAMKPEGVALDFSSLAKGFAVDQAAQALRERGIVRFLFEVGGEIAVSGFSARGEPWRVAVEAPASAGRAVAEVLSVTDLAVATSGNYRNFFDYAGQRYSHSIDPRTGWPVVHDLVSVTVVHEDAMLADAWATAFTVMGAEEAMKLAESREMAVYFIRRVADEYEHSHSQALAAFLPGARQ